MSFYIFSIFFATVFLISAVSILILIDEKIKGYLKMNTKWKEVEKFHYLLVIGALLTPISLIVVNLLGGFK